LNSGPVKQGPNAKFELYLAAVLGVLVQRAVLVVAGFIEYFDPWTQRFREGTSSGSYAFPLTCVGTVALAFGMFLTAHVIEQGSAETAWVYHKKVQDSTESPGIKILWLQSNDTVNDQLFDSYAVMGRGARSKIITSQISVPGAKGT
jgi:hypothetical protein